MSALLQPDFVAAWTVKMQAAAERHPAVSFDGRTALPAWLAESAQDQAERVFLTLDAIPVERRDLGWAEGFVETSGLEFLLAWGEVMALFRSDAEPWAKDAADAAVMVYSARLDELAPGLHAGGAA